MPSDHIKPVYEVVAGENKTENPFSPMLKGTKKEWNNVPYLS